MQPVVFSRLINVRGTTEELLRPMPWSFRLETEEGSDLARLPAAKHIAGDRNSTPAHCPARRGPAPPLSATAIGSQTPSFIVCHCKQFTVMPVDAIHLLIGIMFVMISVLACRIYSTQR